MGKPTGRCGSHQDRSTRAVRTYRSAAASSPWTLRQAPSAFWRSGRGHRRHARGRGGHLRPHHQVQLGLDALREVRELSHVDALRAAPQAARALHELVEGDLEVRDVRARVAAGEDLEEAVDVVRLDLQGAHPHLEDRVPDHAHELVEAEKAVLER